MKAVIIKLFLYNTDMENLHETSELLSEEDIARITAAFAHAWTDDTCYPTLRTKWSGTNKALGQCAVTALIVHDMYGGTFADDKHLNHVWNILPDGSQQDFCRTQFGIGTEIVPTSSKTRDDLLHHKKAEEVEMEKRYRLLKKRFDIYFP